MEKATLRDVTKIAKPFLTRRLFKWSYIEMEQILPLSAALMHYKNLSIGVKVLGDTPHFRIKVKSLLTGGELLYEIRKDGVPIHTDSPDRIAQLHALHYTVSNRI